MTDGEIFSLECTQCDAGMDLASIDHAVAAGWIDVVEHDGPAWTHLGVCPECQKTEDRVSE